MSSRHALVTAGISSLLAGGTAAGTGLPPIDLPIWYAAGFIIGLLLYLGYKLSTHPQS